MIFFSEEDYDAFCLAYMFTYRDFEMGTLGLAWTGDLKNAGGVCEKNGVNIDFYFFFYFFQVYESLHLFWLVHFFL
jgi:hypothetical protein